MVDDVLRYFLFGLQRIILATFAINNANLVCIVTEAGSRVIQRVEDDKVKVFTFELSFGILLGISSMNAEDEARDIDRLEMREEVEM